MDKGSWRQLRLRSKGSVYSLGTVVCGKEVPKGSRSTDDKKTLRWPGSGLRGKASLLGCLVWPAPTPPVPLTQGGVEAAGERTASQSWVCTTF